MSRSAEQPRLVHPNKPYRHGGCANSWPRRFAMPHHRDRIDNHLRVEVDGAHAVNGRRRV
jgi:hypothetical protein